MPVASNEPLITVPPESSIAHATAPPLPERGGGGDSDGGGGGGGNAKYGASGSLGRSLASSPSNSNTPPATSTSPSFSVSALSSAQLGSDVPSQPCCPARNSAPPIPSAPAPSPARTRTDSRGPAAHDATTRSNAASFIASTRRSADRRRSHCDDTRDRVGRRAARSLRRSRTGRRSLRLALGP